MNVHWHTVDRLFNKWNDADSDEKFSALHSASGQGAKIKLKPVAVRLPELVEKHSRNLKLILDTLEEGHNIKVGKITLQNFLKPAGL